MRPRRLLLRVYLFGVLTLLCVAVAQFTVGQLLLGPMSRSGMHMHLKWIVEKALPADATPESQHQEMVQLHQQTGIQISLYDLAGRLLDNTAALVFPPLTPTELANFRAGKWQSGRPWMPFPVGRFVDGKLVGYAMVQPRRSEPPPGRVIMPMLLALLIVGGASIPFARSLTKPLELLAAKARRLGQGDLRVRAAANRQDEVGDVARAFNEMAERIEHLLHAEKELLANVSHELRTPLARIRVAMDLAGHNGQTVNYVPEIAEDLAEIERMVDDILTAARLDLAQDRVGRMTTPLRREPTDPRQVLARAVARFSDHHPDRDLVVKVPDELPTVQADPAMLRRVLDNLLENAHKYSNAEQSIELRAQAVATLGVATAIEMVIRDEGIGIDEADLPHVFTPFFRSDRSRARQTGGVGLGLPLARRIVSAHGGNIELHSKVGVGTTATVRIPIR